MRKNRKQLFILMLSLALLLSISITMKPRSAQANASGVTLGDVQAVFNASFTGGLSIRFHGGEVTEGAPADASAAGVVVIRPFPAFDGKHYCAEDWHILLVTFIFVPDYRTSKEDAQNLEVNFFVDGILLEEVMDTPLKMTAFKDWAKNFGYFLPPGSLTGEHTFKVTDSLGEQFQITFFIDPAGTGTCLE